MQANRQIGGRGACRLRTLAICVLASTLLVALLALAGCSEGSTTSSSTSSSSSASASSSASSEQALAITPDAPNSLYVGAWNVAGVFSGGSDEPTLIPAAEAGLDGQLTVDSSGYGMLDLALNDSPLQFDFLLQASSNGYDMVSDQGTTLGGIDAQSGDGSTPDQMIAIVLMGEEGQQIVFMFTK